MICGVTCPTCGSPIEDEMVARVFNMRAAGYHVVLQCRCGEHITERRVAECSISTCRSMLRGPTVET